MEEARKKADYGNGRLSRNLVESAILSAAMRVHDRITDETFRLREDDFELPDNMKPDRETRRIGFSAA